MWSSTSVDLGPSIPNFWGHGSSMIQLLPYCYQSWTVSALSIVSNGTVNPSKAALNATKLTQYPGYWWQSLNLNQFRAPYANLSYCEDSSPTYHAPYSFLTLLAANSPQLSPVVASFHCHHRSTSKQSTRYVILCVQDNLVICTVAFMLL